MSVQSFYYAGTRVNAENARRTKREDFIARFLPQLVFFSKIPIKEREKELGVLWDLCQDKPEPETTIPAEDIPKKTIKISKKDNNAKRTTITGEVGADGSQQDSDSRSPGTTE